MAIDKERLLNSVEEIISLEAKTVLTLGWDGGVMPGTSGAYWVTSWKGLFFLESSDVDPQGPFECLDEVLECEEFSVITARPELSSNVLKLKELKEIGLRLVAEGDSIWINETKFVRRGDELVKAD